MRSETRRKSRILIKTPEEVECMRESGRVAATILRELADKCSPGVTTLELDEYGRELMNQMGATSAFLGYKGYPAHICTSVNEEVVHGIPNRRRLQLGDIISIDVGTIFEGWVGDNATTVMVGVQDSDVIRLVRTTERALHAAIDKAVAGRRLSDVSHAVEATARAERFSVVREFVGHGVGRTMHEEPQIPNFGAPGKGPVLQPGMTLAIEPMINLGSGKVDVLDDGWTVLTRDRRVSAHFEHTVLVLEGRAEILTCARKS